MKKKNLLILAFVAIVGIIAYIVITGNPKAEKAEFARGNSFAVVPMNIKAGTTHHYLTDYYPQWEGADEVTTADERLTLTATDNLANTRN